MRVVFSDHFRDEFKRIKDGSLKDRVIKAARKLEVMPECGKPLTHDLKGHRRLVVAPFRVIYKIENGNVLIVNFEHRKSVYK